MTAEPPGSSKTTRPAPESGWPTGTAEGVEARVVTAEGSRVPAGTIVVTTASVVAMSTVVPTAAVVPAAAVVATAIIAATPIVIAVAATA